jgi:hypothetical protein
MKGTDMTEQEKKERPSPQQAAVVKKSQNREVNEFSEEELNKVAGGKPSTTEIVITKLANTASNTPLTE